MNYIPLLFVTDMGTDRYKRFVEEILSSAGISINGGNPWDIRIKNERFYRRVVREGSLGLGESFMDGWWECERLDEFFCRLLSIDPEGKIKKGLKFFLHVLPAFIFNLSSKSRAFQIGERHYDRGNDLYRCMLDRRMIYSCGYWKDAPDLDAAQEAKLDLICRKTGLQPGDTVLDIGCGWGGFAKYAAGHYGAKVVGITVSKGQTSLASESCAGLPVEIRLQDYRDLAGEFDHIVSIGMFEHVGRKNYRTYMETVHRCLRAEGLFLLHTIGNSRSQVMGDPWVDKYIFPNSMIPSMKQIGEAAEGLFIIEDVHNFGPYYDTTLCAWLENFEKNWDKLKSLYDDKFYRMWTYYLQMFTGAFRSRHLQVWQIVFSKNGTRPAYQPVR